MKIALTQACLKVKCYFCFSIVADNVILATATSETEFRTKLFVRSGFNLSCNVMCAMFLGVCCASYAATQRGLFGKEIVRQELKTATKNVGRGVKTTPMLFLEKAGSTAQPTL